MSDAGGRTHGDFTTGTGVLRQPPHHRLQSLVKPPTWSRLLPFLEFMKKNKKTVLSSQRRCTLVKNHLYIYIKIILLDQPTSNKLYHSTLLRPEQRTEESGGILSVAYALLHRADKG